LTEEIGGLTTKHGRSARGRGRSSRGCGRSARGHGKSARGRERSIRRGHSSSARGQQKKRILTIVDIQTRTDIVQEVFPFELDKPAGVYLPSGTDTANPESCFLIKRLWKILANRVMNTQNP